MNMNFSKSTIFTFLVLCLGTISCKYDPLYELPVMDEELVTLIKHTSPTGSLSHFTLPESDNLASIPQDAKNPLNFAKIALGQFLFHETGLGTVPFRGELAGTYSCATCHIAELGFKPGRQQGVADGAIGFGNMGDGRVLHSDYNGDDVDAQAARPISLVNVAFVTNSMWNGMFGGGFNNLGTEDRWNIVPALSENANFDFGIEPQNIDGLVTHRMLITEKLVDSLGYRQLFDQAFPEVARSERYNNFTTAMALSAYLRSILTNRAPFQLWLKGNVEAMTEQQKRGAMLFFGQAGCVRCHEEANLGGNRFEALGVKDLYMNTSIDVFRSKPDDMRNFGRGGFTGKAEDMFRYKVPGIYNQKNSPFYFHGASATTLDEVIAYKNRGISENPNVPQSQLSEFFHPLNLNADQIADLKAFVEDGLYDPDIIRYRPAEIRSGNCFPNNDPLSNQETGCGH